MSTSLAAASAPVAASVLDDSVEIARFSRAGVDAAGAPLAESFLRLGGIRCAACATTIERALRQVGGVVDAQVSAASQSARVKWQPERTRPSVLVDAIVQAGYAAVPDTAAGARALRRHESRGALWRFFVAAFCAMQIMMLAAPSYVGAPGELNPDLARLFAWASWLLTLPVMCFSARPFLAGAWRSVRAGAISMDVPAALGMVVAFVASSGAAFDPGGPFGREMYFDSLTMFVAFLLGGRWLEMLARHRAESALEASIGRLPEIAWREAADGSVDAVSVLRLQRGDRVRVPVGQAFGADGVLVQGETRVDESALSGESVAVRKACGDTVMAGSLNLGAPVAMRVERVGADTRYEAIVALMREARSGRPGSARLGDRWAASFLWAVLILAAGAAAVWSVVDPARAVWITVSVLIVTCPCAFALAEPSARLAATMAMARRGVLLRRLEAIEGLATMQRLFIDKTGTLTEARAASQPGAQGAEMLRVDAGAHAESDEALRGIAASLAGWSAHPMARALATGHVGASEAWLELRETAGEGIEARAADGSVWRLGKPGGALPRAPSGSAEQRPEPAALVGSSATCLSRNGRPLALFHRAEVLRPGGLDAVRALQADGVAVTVLSGDAAGRVAQVAARLGGCAHQGAMAPQDKLAAVRAAQASGECVGMVGDGINDAPVLAQADVSLAMGEGAQIARVQADGVLVSNALGDVVRARAIAKRARRVMRQNFVWAGVYNAACVPLALVGWMPPWVAGLGMAASSLGVVLNSLRLAR